MEIAKIKRGFRKPQEAQEEDSTIDYTAYVLIVFPVPFAGDSSGGSGSHGGVSQARSGCFHPCR